MNSRWPKFDKKKHSVDQVNFLDLFSAHFSKNDLFDHATETKNLKEQKTIIFI